LIPYASAVDSRLLNAPDFVVLSPESAKARPLELAIVGGMAMGRAHTRALVSLVWQLGELGVG